MLSRVEVEAIGFAELGENIQLSEHARFYGVNRISIGNHVRIDDYCILSAGSGGIRIGNHVHIAVFSSLIGQGEIILSDFSNISSRVSIYSSSDDYSGASLTNPTIPSAFKNVVHDKVRVGRHAIIGSGSVILPGVNIDDGAAVGALSLIKHDCSPFTIYAGCPARIIKKRSRALLEFEKNFPD
ncbi:MULTISPECIES: acyltransferase [Acidithiobacillus]|uniref:acyltransferase n=1 Tax=Acidithiobacillus TaxID=119977 RepID=UPI00187A8355|nr:MULTISPECIES: acyltransferase [Acidithiobacillus]MBE7565680.1 acyltransferase [Acidithiobacillus sp. HP-11]